MVMALICGYKIQLLGAKVVIPKKLVGICETVCGSKIRVPVPKKKKKNPIISISTTTVLKMINNTDKEVSPKNQTVYNCMQIKSSNGNLLYFWVVPGNHIEMSVWIWCPSPAGFS